MFDSGNPSSLIRAVKREKLECRGVYGFFDNDELLYIGESKHPLDLVESNHRKYLEKFGFDETFPFRQHLKLYHADSGTFKWILPADYRTVEDSKNMMSELINMLHPRYNFVYDTVDLVVKSCAYILPSDL